MEKKLLHSDKEYFDYCIENGIGDISRRMCSQMCSIQDGESCSEGTYINDGKEWLQIDSKPTHYPCVLVWNLNDDSDHDFYSGIIIYQEDLK